MKPIEISVLTPQARALELYLVEFTNFRGIVFAHFDSILF